MASRVGLDNRSLWSRLSKRLRTGLVVLAASAAFAQDAEQLVRDGIKAFEAGKSAEAEQLLTRAYQADSDNEAAAAWLALITYQLKRPADSAAWHEKVIKINPRNKDSHHSLGVIAWEAARDAVRVARRQLGMTPAEPGPLRDAKVRSQLKEKYMASLDAGIAHLEKAVDLDFEFDDAMAYLNLAIRTRADLVETALEYKEEIAVADTWLDRALEVKKRKAPAKK